MRGAAAAGFYWTVYHLGLPNIVRSLGPSLPGTAENSEKTRLTCGDFIVNSSPILLLASCDIVALYRLHASSEWDCTRTTLDLES